MATARTTSRKARTVPVIFDGFGCEVVVDRGRFRLRYDSTEGLGSPAVEREISEGEATRVTRSQRDADAVIRLAERRDKARGL